MERKNKKIKNLECKNHINCIVFLSPNCGVLLACLFSLKAGPYSVTAKKVLGKKIPGEKILKFHTKIVLWKKVLLLKSLRK